MSPPLDTRPQNWTHPSVVAMAEGRDAVDAIIARARHVALSEMDSGWSGPPFDPFKLAERLGIDVVPSEDIRDARVIFAAEPSRFQIEYNPNRPPYRIRFSLAHEIAHTLFADCGQFIRNRLARHELTGDDWQLEMLCNIAASELLMPVSSFPTLKDEMPSIDGLMNLRNTFDVSAEAVLLRFARSTAHPCFVFAASRAEDGGSRIDYVVEGGGWTTGVRCGMDVSDSRIIRQCTAVDYTSKGDEQWPSCVERFHIEAVGVPPYPNRSLPRVVGFGSPLTTQPKLPDLLTFLKGDATEPRAHGENIIVHIVNDSASHWHGPFAAAITRKWPHVEASFTDWVKSDRRRLVLGTCHRGQAEPNLSVVSMVAQHGYGGSSQPRIRYAGLETCLLNVAAFVSRLDSGATVNMPKIGTGQAGGKWEIIEEIIRDTLVQYGVPVMVYELPGKSDPVSRQRGLFD
jgi:O-acetyl-ADP-ribose deacetylase (regulator of RNase III)